MYKWLLVKHRYICVNAVLLNRRPSGCSLQWYWFQKQEKGAKCLKYPAGRRTSGAGYFHFDKETSRIGMLNLFHLEKYWSIRVKSLLMKLWIATFHSNKPPLWTAVRALNLTTRDLRTTACSSFGTEFAFPQPLVWIPADATGLLPIA